MLLYNLLLCIVTLAGGSAPLWLKGIDDKRTNYLLAFSGAFLLSITLLHLLPETFEELGHRAGFFVLAGFFVQLLIQRLTHGAEHGHTHIHVEGEHHRHDHPDSHHTHTHEHAHAHSHQHTIPLLSIILGLSLHAFMEGLPLGFNYRSEATTSSLYLAVAAHKLPEAMLLTSLVWNIKGRQKAFTILILFSLITPFASLLADMLGKRYWLMSNIVMWLVPVVAGAFIHIATTIFFESGTRHHMLTWQKTLAILFGVTLGLTTLLFE